MWKQHTDANRHQLTVPNDGLDLFEVYRQVHTGLSSVAKSSPNSNFFVMHEGRSPTSTPLVKLNDMHSCDFADKCRAMGYISYVIQCYRLLLDHQSRRHNNLAACYQDSDDNEKALAMIYRRRNDWHMVQNYYQLIVDQLKSEGVEPSIIERYERNIKNAIEKIIADRISRLKLSFWKKLSSC
ncbi:unnamed protein product [Adineta ricciae]|uniref:Uncharacterized protein n=1 Tax=Adineta ricciae TaxID=249248 RepID=A0A815MAL1_ADIRI|nr:unnamed protein product [Adineta ricciae]CAF1419899.1 unnamed protein product [Adineta ricciae]